MTLLLVQASRGVDEPTAVAATILTRLATLWLAVVLGVIALAVLRRVAPETRALAKTAADTGDGVENPAAEGGDGETGAILRDDDSD